MKIRITKLAATIIAVVAANKTIQAFQKAVVTAVRTALLIVKVTAAATVAMWVIGFLVDTAEGRQVVQWCFNRPFAAWRWWLSLDATAAYALHAAICFTLATVVGHVCYAINYRLLEIKPYGLMEKSAGVMSGLCIGGQALLLPAAFPGSVWTWPLAGLSLSIFGIPVLMMAVLLLVQMTIAWDRWTEKRRNRKRRFPYRGLVMLTL